MLKEFGNAAWSFIKDHKAQILIGAGIVGNTAATVFACKQTLTAKTIIEDHKDRRNEVYEAKEICKREIKIYDVAVGKEKGGKYYTEQKPCSTSDYLKYTKYLERDSKKELAKVYGLTGLKFVRHYALPGALYLASNIAICFGMGILTKQVAGLTTSLAAVTTAYTDYRERVKKALGEEAEKRIFNNEQVKTVKYKDVDDNGEEIEKEKDVITIDGKYDPYSILLDRNSWLYDRNILNTLRNIKQAEYYLTEQLRGRNKMVLNEVYDYIGPYDKTEAGAIVGWCRDNKDGDGYIDFGIFDHTDKDSGFVSEDPLYLTDEWKSILDSHEGMPNQYDTDSYDIWLHFNVDGQITKFMNKRPGKPI